MAWRGSISRSLMSTAARSSTFRSSSAPRVILRPPPPPPRRFSFSNPRLLGELACAQSLMPLSAAPSHLARACVELSHGMEKMGDVSCRFLTFNSEDLTFVLELFVGSIKGLLNDPGRC